MRLRRVKIKCENVDKLIRIGGSGHGVGGVGGGSGKYGTAIIKKYYRPTFCDKSAAPAPVTTPSVATLYVGVGAGGAVEGDDGRVKADERCCARIRVTNANAACTNTHARTHEHAKNGDLVGGGERGE